MSKKKQKAPGAHFPLAAARRTDVPSERPFQKGSRRGNAWAATVLLILPFALYWECVRYGYVLDDHIVITHNRFTQNGFAGLGDIFAKETFAGYADQQPGVVLGGRYRPLSLATFAVEREFFSAPKRDLTGVLVKDKSGKMEFAGNPHVSHAVNILLYACCGLLLFRLLSLMLPAGNAAPWYWNVPFLASLLFIAHPVHVEAVANIKGRDEILSLLGVLSTLYCSYRYLEFGKSIWWLLSGFFFFLGLLSKENAITFLAIVPLTLWYFARQRPAVLARILLPLAAAAAAYLTIRYRVIGYLFDSGGRITDIMNNPFYGMNGSQKYATILYTLGEYLRLLVFPHPLTHDYYPYHVPVMDWSRAGTLVSLLAHAAMIWIAIRGMRARSVISYSILFYLITLSIVSNLLFSVGTFMSERFIFVSSIGFCLCIAWLAERFSRVATTYKKMRAAYLAPTLAMLLLLGFCGLTYARVPAWESDLILNRAGIEVSPDSCLSNSYYATDLFREYLIESDETRKQGILAEAGRYCRKSLAINPAYYPAHITYSRILIEEFKYDHDLGKLLNGFYEILSAKDRMALVEQQLVFLQEHRPEYKDALIAFYRRLALDNYLPKREYDLADLYLNTALSLDPGNARLAADREMVRKMSGR